MSSDLQSTDVPVKNLRLETPGVGVPQAAALPQKRGRGRPKGSKNKPKPSGASSTGDVAPVKKKCAWPRGIMSMKAVDTILNAHSITDVDKVSKCLKAGILHGNVKLLKPEDDPEKKFGLDQVLAQEKCLMGCGPLIKCTIQDILYQSDYGGRDYAYGEHAPLHCTEDEECPGIYVTRICSGDATFDSGKSHNHCTFCPTFGTCIGDYRETHCRKCGDHYFSGCCGGKCFTCFPDYDPMENCPF